MEKSLKRALRRLADLEKRCKVLNKCIIRHLNEKTVIPYHLETVSKLTKKAKLIKGNEHSTV